MGRLPPPSAPRLPSFQPEPGPNRPATTRGGGVPVLAVTALLSHAGPASARTTLRPPGRQPSLYVHQPVMVCARLPRSCRSSAVVLAALRVVSGAPLRAAAAQLQDECVLAGQQRGQLSRGRSGVEGSDRVRDGGEIRQQIPDGPVIVLDQRASDACRVTSSRGPKRQAHLPGAARQGCSYSSWSGTVIPVSRCMLKARPGVGLAVTSARVGRVGADRVALGVEVVTRFRRSAGQHRSSPRVRRAHTSYALAEEEVERRAVEGLGVLVQARV